MQHSMLALAIAVTLAAGACHDPIGPDHADLPAHAIAVRFGSDPQQWPLDPYEVRAARIERDSLVLTVRYGGGCREHTFRFVAWDGWLLMVPVGAHAILTHDADGDLCRALLTTELRFDLAPLAAAWRRTYGPGPGEAQILLTDPDDIGGRPLRTFVWSVP